MPRNAENGKTMNEIVYQFDDILENKDPVDERKKL